MKLLREEDLSLGAILEPVARHELLGTLDRSLLAKVVAGCTVRGFGANRPLLKSGDPPQHVLFLLEGKVRVYYRHDEGKELLIKLFRAPALMCEMEILADIPIMPNARTLSESRILFMPAPLFRRLVETNLAFSRVLATDLATRLCVASDRQRALAFADVEYRLSSLLLDYAHLSGVPQDRGILIDLPITQDGMARDLAVTRKAVNDMLRKLKREGVLSKLKGRYVVLDPNALRRRCSHALLVTHNMGIDVPDLKVDDGQGGPQGHD